MKKVVLLLAILLVLMMLLVATGCTQQVAEKKPTAKKPVVATKPGELTLEQIREIQPGLGPLMFVYGRRFWILYYAAKAGNWDLAAYEKDEMEEILEVAEITRPKRAKALKEFKEAYLNPLSETIKAKDWVKFEAAYNEALKGCNDCHTGQTDSEGKNFSFIKVVLPKNPPETPQTIP